MNLREETDKALRAIPGSTVGDLRRHIMDRTGHTVHTNTLAGHLSSRTKLDGGADVRSEDVAAGHGGRTVKVYYLQERLT